MGDIKLFIQQVRTGVQMYYINYQHSSIGGVVLLYSTKRKAYDNKDTFIFNKR